MADTASLENEGTVQRCLSNSQLFPNAPLLKEKQSAWNLGHVTEGRKARARSQRTSSILWAQDHLPSVQYKIMLIFALLVCGLWKPIARKVLLL